MRRLRPGLNPRTWVLKASPLGGCCTKNKQRALFLRIVFNSLAGVPQSRPPVGGLSRRRIGFDRWTVCVLFLGDEVTLGEVYLCSRLSVFPRQYHSTNVAYLVIHTLQTLCSPNPRKATVPLLITLLSFMISNFPRVLSILYFLLGIFPASELYMPTFRNTLSVPFSYHLPMKMEQIECSETSAYIIQTLGKYPKENII